MSSNSMYLKGVLLMTLLALFSGDIQAQKQTEKISGSLQGSFNPDRSSEVQILSQPIDTLRNFDPTVAPLTWFVSLDSLQRGFVHGTNDYGDLSKATLFTPPSNAVSTSLTEVVAYFARIDPAVTTETYDVEIRAVDATTGGPGALIGSQTFNLSDANIDQANPLSILPTPHRFATPLDVSQPFFVVLNYQNAYGVSDFDNITVWATDNLGQFSAEDWEQLDDGSWINMSESWFAEDAPTNGWHMWIEAVVDVTQAADNVAPAIVHTGSTERVTEGQSITVQVDVTDAGSGVRNVFLNFIEGGRDGTGFESREMNLVSGNTYEGEIPGNFVNGRGLQYRISAFDNNDNSSISDFTRLLVRLEDGLSQDLSVSGTDANSYRLFSVPINLDNDEATRVFIDDLGTYNPENWRFFDLLANQTYAEFPNVGRLSRGKGFWLATSQSGQTVNTGPGETGSTEFLGESALNPGWTFIGTHFNYPVQLSQARLESGRTTLDIRTFDGTWRPLNGAMQPFRGYAVASVDSDRMFVEPFILSGKQAGVSVASKAPEEFDWAISIKASSGAILDADNLLAVAEQASHDWDELDRPEPPVIGEYISLYFPHEDWDVPFSHFNADIRPAFETSQQWDFEVRTNVEELIELSFEGIESLPPSFEVQLVDKKLHHAQDLRVSSTYSITASEDDLKERFAIIVGAASAVSEELDDLVEIPQALSLRSYPNPFQTQVTLEYGLPDASEVTIEVYDLIGKKVTTLLQGVSKREGMHVVQWDGADASGRSLANGIYMFTIQTGESRATQKVVLLR